LGCCARPTIDPRHCCGDVQVRTEIAPVWILLANARVQIGVVTRRTKADFRV